MIYKIVGKTEWDHARTQGVFSGSQVDLDDGYIHFSTSEQLIETMEKHFSGQSDLLLIEINDVLLGDKLKWEPSRGGDLFPHLYSDLKFDSVVQEWPIPDGQDRESRVKELVVSSKDRTCD